MIPRSGLAALGLLLLAACSPAPPPRADGVEVIEGAAFKLRSRVSCLVSYVAVRGPIVTESRARIDLALDTGPLTPGWEVTAVETLVALPNAEGFDPWLQFTPGIRRKFLHRDDRSLHLAESEGVPLILDRVTGDIGWSREGSLGETEYTGSCV